MTQPGWTRSALYKGDHLCNHHYITGEMLPAPQKPPGLSQAFKEIPSPTPIAQIGPAWFEQVQKRNQAEFSLMSAAPEEHLHLVDFIHIEEGRSFALPHGGGLMIRSVAICTPPSLSVPAVCPHSTVPHAMCGRLQTTEAVAFVS